MRLELTHRNRHYPLKVACLPISPPAQDICLMSVRKIELFLLCVPKTGLEPAQRCRH